MRECSTCRHPITWHGVLLKRSRRCKLNIIRICTQRKTVRQMMSPSITCDAWTSVSVTKQKPANMKRLWVELVKTEASLCQRIVHESLWHWFQLSLSTRKYCHFDRYSLQLLHPQNIDVYGWARVWGFLSILHRHADAYLSGFTLCGDPGCSVD